MQECAKSRVDVLLVTTGTWSREKVAKLYILGSYPFFAESLAPGGVSYRQQHKIGRSDSSLSKHWNSIFLALTLQTSCFAVKV